MRKVFLSTQEIEQIRNAVREVESQTSGELVTVIAEASDDYLYIPLLWAALIAFLLPGVIFLITPLTEILPVGDTWGVPIVSSFLPVWQVQILVFVSLALIFRWQPVKMRLIPRAVKQRRSNRLAYEQFYMQGVHLTQHRTGILLFVSVAEHYVEVIADQGICEKVEPEIWKEVVDQFVGDVKRGNIALGFLNSIEQCGKSLIHYFPAEPGNINELSDHLVQL